MAHRTPIEHSAPRTLMAPETHMAPKEHVAPLAPGDAFSTPEVLLLWAVGGDATVPIWPLCYDPYGSSGGGQTPEVGPVLPLLWCWLQVRAVLLAVCASGAV